MHVWCSKFDYLGIFDDILLLNTFYCIYSHFKSFSQLFVDVLNFVVRVQLKSNQHGKVLVGGLFQISKYNVENHECHNDFLTKFSFHINILTCTIFNHYFL